MKVIVYDIDLRLNRQDEHAVIGKTAIPYSEENLEYAKANSVTGEYTIEDDGVEETAEPTQLDMIEAQITYTAMMTDTLLEV